METQIIRIPKKYGELINTMEDSEAGKLIKSIMNQDIDYKLTGLTLTYFNIIKVDIDNIQNQVMQGKKGGKKGGRPKKEITPPLGEEKTPGVIEKKTPPLGNKKPKYSKVKISKDKISKDIIINNNTEQSSENPSEVSTKIITYGNEDINNTLKFLCKAVGIDEFKETHKWQRVYGKHFVKYKAKIGGEDFLYRLKGVLSDDFKQSNCNSIKYLYNEMKAFIHSPIVPTEKKETEEQERKRKLAELEQKKILLHKQNKNDG